MFDTFRHSYRVRRAYSTNSIIYYLKTIPLIGKHISSDNYSSGPIRTLANVLYALKAIFGFCLGEIIYLLAILGGSAAYADGVGAMTGSQAFMNIFFFFALIGVLLNTYVFDVTEDKYYSIYMLKMDPREFVLSDMYYRVLRKLVGYVVMFIVIGRVTKVPLGVCLMFIAMTILGKGVGAYIKLQFVKKNKLGSSSGFLVCAVALIFALGVVVTFLLKMVVPVAVIYGVGGVISLAGIYCFYKLHTYEDYPQTCKYFLNVETVVGATDKENTEEKAAKESIKVEVTGEDATSNKEGYAYFNDLFVKRHSKLLKKRTRIISIVLLVVLVVGLAFLFVATRFFGMEKITNIPVFLYSMPLVIYYLNNGETLATVMFMNCDSAMLTYNFYRRADVLLGVFRSRLKTVVKYNIIPALLLSCCLAVMCAFSTEATHVMTYVSIFVLCPALSVFFSVHRLVVYYLLQPYTEGLEKKRSSYGIVNYVTYIACYIIFMQNSDIKLAPMVFTGISVIFTVIYVLVALALVYKFAPKRFIIHK